MKDDSNTTFTRVGNVITIILPNSDTDNNICSVCGAKAKKGSKVTPILNEDNQSKIEKAVGEELSDTNMFCVGCKASIRGLSKKVIQTAYESLPRVHTVSLEVGYFGHHARVLKPDCKFTIEDSVFFDEDPYLDICYKGWDKKAKTYLKFEDKIEIQEEILLSQKVDKIIEEKILIKQIARDFSLNLIKRLKGTS